MTLDEKYKINRSIKMKSYLKLFCMLMIVLAISFTFSAYTGIGNITGTFEVAQFKVAINGEEIESNEVDTIDNIKLVVTDGSTDGTIRAGDNGYFDIEIDPSGTEASLEYFIGMDFSGLPSQINMESYSTIKNSIESSKSKIPSENKFSGEISLDKANNHEKLDATDKITYRIYWKWLGKDWEMSSSDYNLSNELSVDVIVQQKI